MNLGMHSMAIEHWKSLWKSKDIMYVYAVIAAFHFQLCVYYWGCLQPRGLVTA